MTMRRKKVETNEMAVEKLQSSKKDSKIIGNLLSRREILVEDNNKIYDDF